jgi:aminopeptidase
MKTVEHPHLGSMATEQYRTFINALDWDPNSPRGDLARKLKERIDRAKNIVVKCQDTELVYESEMQPTLLNIGDYTGMKNIGGTFPVGEVFSEPKELNCVNGEVMIWGFPNMDRLMEVRRPSFKVIIKDGLVVGTEGAPESFTKLLDLIREAEGEIVVREFGLGLNPAMSRDVIVNVLTAFERQEVRIFNSNEKL